LYLLLAGKRREFVVATVSALAVTLVSAIVVPGPSAEFWGRLVRGDTGLGHSIIYYTNQSVMADVVRVLGLGSGPAVLGLAGSAVVALVGVWAAVLWHRRGEVGLAVNLCGVAGLLASPVSWLHHFVWIVPLGVSLVLAGPGHPRRLPRAMLVLGWVFIGWVAAAPFRRLPNGADVELNWSWHQHLLASVTAAVGVAFLVAAIITAGRVSPTPTNAQQPAGPGSVRGSQGPGDPHALPQSISGGSRPPGS
jgi:alpha-1,2-mannosyltransferase